MTGDMQTRNDRWTRFLQPDARQRALDTLSYSHRINSMYFGSRKKVLEDENMPHIDG